MTLKQLKDYVNEYVSLYCHDDYTFWSVMENENSEEYLQEILQEFYDLTKDIDVYEINKVDGITLNEVYINVYAVNNGYYSSLDSDDYFYQVIIGEYDNKSEHPARDFFNDYGAMDKDNIIYEYIKYDEHAFYDEERDIVVWQS